MAYSTEIYQLTYQALLLILLLSGPPILISTILGLVVAIFQAATQNSGTDFIIYGQTSRSNHNAFCHGRLVGCSIMQFTNNIFSISQNGLRKTSFNVSNRHLPLFLLEAN